MSKFLIEMILITVVLTTLSYIGIGEITARHTLFLVVVGLVAAIGSKLYDHAKLKYRLLVGSLVSVASSLFIIRYFSPDILRVWEVNTYIGYVVAESNIIAFILSLIPISKLGFVIRWSVLYIAILPILIVWGHFISNGVWISADAIVAILQSNSSEMLDYLCDVVGVNRIAIILLISGAVNYFITRYTQFKCKDITVKKVGLMVLFCILNIVLLIRTSDNMLTEHYFEAMDYADKFQEFKLHQQERASNIAQDISFQKNGNKGIYVLVIGESQTRDHMSAFGYGRKTTPWLDSMKNDNHAILFPNSYSNYCQTVKALSYALTTKNQYNDLDLAESLSLIEIANAAGYKTVWISNQVRYSIYDTPTTIIAENSDERYWMNSHAGETFSTNYLDEEVVNKLDEIEYSDKMLIVLHFMGNHISYEDRYSKDFDIFSGSDLPGMDRYDNSILYNDHVMKTLMDKLQQIPNFQCMMYMADHGEGASVDMAHDPDSFVWEMARIPMYVIFSEDFLTNQSNKVSNLKKNSNEYFTNDLVLDSLLGIMGISLTDYNIDNNDIASEKYDINPEKFKTLHGKFFIKDNTGDNVTVVRNGKE